MRRVWLAMLALAGCRQVFGLDEPLLAGGGSVDARRGDAFGIFFDGATPPMPGLAMYVEDGAQLWINDQPPDTAWAQTDNSLAKTTVWTGADPTLGELVLGGLIDGQRPFSVWMEGQVLVPQGTEQIELKAADYAFFDMEMVPYTGQFQHLVTSRNGNANAKMFSPALPGWLRVRIGWSTSPNTSQFDLTRADGAAPNMLMLFGSANLRH